MPRKKSPQIRVGISGWTYVPWRGVFYPKSLPQKQELRYASRMLNSVEINGTFYSLQRPSSFQTWYDATPENFVFSIKGGQYITHMRRLRDVQQPLANFLASGLLVLKEKLGPILWQFPPNFAFDADRFDAFFDLLPRDTESALRIARGHDDWVKGRAFLEIDTNRPMRYAVEIRNPSFEQAAFIDLLRKHGVALVLADTAGRWSFSEDMTTDFVYARLHGAEEIYASGYTPAALDWWAARLQRWSAGGEPDDARRWSARKAPKASSRDVFIYFDNDVKVKAPFDAMSLAQRLGPSARGVDANEQPAVTPKLTKKALAERVRSHWPTPSR